MTPTIPTETEIHAALCRECFYGQQAKKVVVPFGYSGKPVVDGIPIEVARAATIPYIVPTEGGRLAFDGSEIYD